jgi:thioredoxin 1
MAAPVHIESVAQFDGILKDNTYTLIDFTASWCPPCRQIAPIFEKLSKANSKEGGFAFVKVDVDEQRDIAAKYKITAMPTFILLKDGEPVNNLRGADVVGLNTLVKDAAKDLETVEAKTSEPTTTSEAPAGDEPTVSGGYTLGSGSHSDWKTTL